MPSPAAARAGLDSPLQPAALFLKLSPSPSQRKRHLPLLETDRVGLQLLPLEPDQVTTSTAAKCLPPRLLTMSAAFGQTGSRARGPLRSPAPHSAHRS